MTAQQWDELMVTWLELDAELRRVVEEGNRILLKKLEQLRREWQALHRETRAEMLSLAGISYEEWQRVYSSMQNSGSECEKETDHG